MLRVIYSFLTNTILSAFPLRSIKAKFDCVTKFDYLYLFNLWVTICKAHLNLHISENISVFSMAISLIVSLKT